MRVPVLVLLSLKLSYNALNSLLYIIDANCITLYVHSRAYLVEKWRTINGSLVNSFVYHRYFRTMSLVLYTLTHCIYNKNNYSNAAVGILVGIAGMTVNATRGCLLTLQTLS